MPCSRSRTLQTVIIRAQKSVDLMLKPFRASSPGSGFSPRAAVKPHAGARGIEPSPNGFGASGHCLRTKLDSTAKPAPKTSAHFKRNPFVTHPIDLALTPEHQLSWQHSCLTKDSAVRLRSCLTTDSGVCLRSVGNFGRPITGRYGCPAWRLRRTGPIPP